MFGEFGKLLVIRQTKILQINLYSSHVTHLMFQPRIINSKAHWAAILIRKYLKVISTSSSDQKRSNLPDPTGPLSAKIPVHPLQLPQ